MNVTIRNVLVYGGYGAGGSPYGAQLSAPLSPLLAPAALTPYGGNSYGAGPYGNDMGYKKKSKKYRKREKKQKKMKKSKKNKYRKKKDYYGAMYGSPGLAPPYAGGYADAAPLYGGE